MKTNATVEDRAVLAKAWADNFIRGLATSEDAIEVEAESVIITAQLMAGEEKIQAEYDSNNDPGKGNEPFLMQILINRLNVLEVPRTRAAEVIASLGLNTPDEAVMMAAVLKRLHAVQSPKPERLTAGHMECLLNGGTVTSAFAAAEWDKQKGYYLNFPCDNLLDIVVPSDFEN